MMLSCCMQGFASEHSDSGAVNGSVAPQVGMEKPSASELPEDQEQVAPDDSVAAAEPCNTNVHVSMAATGEDVCTLHLPETSSVGYLKTLVAKSIELPALRLQLLVDSRVLSVDEELVADLSVSQDTALEVLVMVSLAEDFMDEVVRIRKDLSREQNPPIQEAIDAGVVPRFIRYLQEFDWPELQVEAGWALTNIASGTSEHTRVILANGGLPAFVSTLDSPSKDVREQAVWCLGNIAGDSPDLRDAVLRSGALQKLLEMVDESPSSLPNNVAWALSNFCRGRPAPPFETLQPILPRLPLLLATDCQDDLTDICWMASYLSDGPNDRVHLVVETGCIPRFVDLLRDPHPSLQTPALRVVGNIASSSEDDTQSIVDAGFLQVATTLLSHTKAAIRKETCWVLSNVMGGSQGQIQAVIDSGLVRMLIDMLTSPEESYAVKKEIIFAITNPFENRGPQLDQLIQLGCLEALMGKLSDLPDPKVLRNCLEALRNALQWERESEDHGVASRVRDSGGVEIIENMYGHDQQAVAALAAEIVELLGA